MNNVELGKRGRWRSNVWTYPGASSLGSDARHGLQDHPTVKPTAVLEDGSTLIAADKAGRVCRGAELDPLYADVIIRRYEAATGVAAVLIETSERFTDLAARRAEEKGPDSCPGESQCLMSGGPSRTDCDHGIVGRRSKRQNREAQSDVRHSRNLP